MKFSSRLFLLFFIVPVAMTQAQSEAAPARQTVPTARSVVVLACSNNGDIRVIGTDRNEVHVSGDEDLMIERLDRTSESQPASRVEIILSRNRRTGGSTSSGQGSCRINGDLRVEVPTDSILELRTLNGDISVERVAVANVQSISGNVNIKSVSGRSSVTGVSGDISITDSRGTVRLTNVNGDIDLKDIQANTGNDELEVRTTSGDIILQNVAQTSVTASSVSGNVNFTGRLATRGRYQINVHSGDINFSIPSDSSFHLDATLGSGDFNSSFTMNIVEDTRPAPPMPHAPPAPPAPPAPMSYKHYYSNFSRHIVGAVGSGDASLDLKIFNGDIRLSSSGKSGSQR